MADNTDFVVLYDELGLDPDCSPEQFRQAYRRRVGKLHPDNPDHPTDLARLQRLNRLYEAATEFHRRHGRLPGAARVGAGPAPSRMRMPSPRPGDVEPELAGSRGYLRVLLLVALILAAVMWMLAENAPTQSGAGLIEAIPSGGTERHAARKHDPGDARGISGSA